MLSSFLDKLCAATWLKIIELVLINARHKIFATLAGNLVNRDFFFWKYCPELYTFARVTGLFKTKAGNVKKKNWKIYASKSVITRFYEQGALSRCTIHGQADFLCTTKLTVHVRYRVQTCGAMLLLILNDCDVSLCQRARLAILHVSVIFVCPTILFCCLQLINRLSIFSYLLILVRNV